jgi:hypothetical protein
MKKLASISLLSLYLLFNLGLSFNIHECENGNVELGIFSFFTEDTTSEANKCCHHNEEKESHCNCEDFIVFLELSDDQITATLPSFEGDRSFEYNPFFTHNHEEQAKKSFKKEVLTNPPPLISTYKRNNSTQQLLFYA